MQKNQIHHINVHDLKQVMDNDTKVCLIDVRELNEWQTVRIPGAIHIPKDSIANKIAEVASDKDQAVYLHCQGGVRSLTAAETLNSLGYTNLYSLDGGISDWTIYGYPIEQG